MTPAPSSVELLEAVLQRTLSKPNLTKEDREALEQAVFVTRTLPQVGTVKRNLAARLLRSLADAEEKIQWIISHRKDPDEEDPDGKEGWETNLKKIQDFMGEVQEMEAKKAAKRSNPPTMEPRR